MKDQDLNDEPNPSTETEAQARFRGYIEEAVEEEKAGAHESAMLAVMKALEVAAENADATPSPLDTLLQRKSELEEACDWPAVLEIHKEIIRYTEEVGPLDNPDAPPHYLPAMSCNVWQALAGTQVLLGNYDEALAAAFQAVHFSRQSDLSPLVVNALLDQARCLGRLGRWNEAADAAKDALNANEPDLPFVGLPIAKCRLALARSLARSGDAVAAREQLELAEPILNTPVGHPDALRALWLEAEVEVLYGEGRIDDAIRSLRTAVELRESSEATSCWGAAVAQSATANTTARLAEILAEAGDGPGAAEARKQVEAFRKRFKLPGC